MNRTEFAESLGLTRGAIGTWERGENLPPLSTFDRLCKYLGVEPTEILRYDIRKLEIEGGSEVKEGKNIYRRPTNVILIDGEDHTEELWPMLSTRSPSGKKWYVKQNIGQKMKPTASNGDYIICDQVDNIIDNSLYLLQFKDGHHTFNQVRRDYEYKEAKKLELINHNDLYKSHTVPQDEIEVFYKVYKIMKLYDT